MKFLDRVAIRAEGLKVSLDDIYSADQQYQQFLTTVVSVLRKFAIKFKMTEERALDLFVKSLKREI